MSMMVARFERIRRRCSRICTVFFSEHDQMYDDLHNWKWFLEFELFTAVEVSSKSEILHFLARTNYVGQGKRCKTLTKIMTRTFDNIQ